MCARLGDARPPPSPPPRRVDHARPGRGAPARPRCCPATRSGMPCPGAGQVPGQQPARCGWRSPACAAPWPASLVIAPRKLGAAILAQWDDLTVLPEIAGFRQQDVGGPFDEDPQCLGVLAIEMDGGVALALRRERDFGDARKLRQRVLGHAELARGDDQRTFRGVALHAPAPVAVGERGVIGKRRGAGSVCATASRTCGLSPSGSPLTVKSPSGM